MKPQNISVSSHQIFLTSDPAPQTKEASNSPSKKTLKRLTEQKAPRVGIIKTTRSQNNLMKTVEHLREIRTASEARIQKNLGDIEFTDDGSKEKFTKVRIFSKDMFYNTLKDWKELLKTGRYIGTRGEERMAFRITGRAWNKEKTFQGIRKTLDDVKNEMKNRGKVIKYPSKVEVDPSLLAQPHFTPTDAKPISSSRREPRKSPELSKFKPDMYSELSDFQLETIESPGFVEKEMLFSYNKEQLKKLKGSISFIHKVSGKNKLRKIGVSFVSREASEEKDRRNISENSREIEEDQTELDDYSKYYGGVSNLLGTDVSRRKFYSKKQKIEDRMKSQGKKTELLKKLVGFSPETETSDPQQLQSVTKSSFFRTISDAIPFESPSKSDQNEEVNNYKAFASYRASVPAMEHEEIQNYAPFYLPQQFSSFSPTRKSSEEASSSLMKGLKGGNVNKTARLIRKGVSSGKKNLIAALNNKNQGNFSYRNFQIKENLRQGKVGYKLEVANEEIQKKYKLLTMECENNIKTGSKLQNSLQKSFGTIKGQLNKMGEFITNESCFIDWQIKQDIVSEMQNSQEKYLMKRTRSKPTTNHKNQ